MSNRVQRFLLKAVPLDNHVKYFSWQIATLCILIGDEDENSALQKAINFIRSEKWTPISKIHKSTLIENLIYNQDQSVIEEYEKVISGKDSFLVFTDNWRGFKNSPPLLFPKITEDLIDNVFEQAGGKRLVYKEENKIRNADYVIDNYIFELKLIEEERLLKESVQNKLANFYNSKNSNFIEITTEDFDKLNYSIFTNIFRSPIQEAIKSASEQIKSTKNNILHSQKHKGGIILINNGTSSFTPQIFNECVYKSLNNNTSNIEASIIINIWSRTDGFETSFEYLIEPKNPNEVEKKIQQSFVKVINDFLSTWGHNSFIKPNEVTTPLKPINFEKNNVTFIKKQPPLK
ncbi:hypothetical protein [Flavobacterium sp. UBA4854]|uniref:hypothetical protein n=1 Tax=Flavobacterium sp. UBA4854 TaxID=1946548 RepID=UPI00257A9E2D|nr:hypothetical protein [Flavobacterium sp. UBA4854]